MVPMPIVRWRMVGNGNVEGPRYMSSRRKRKRRRTVTRKGMMTRMKMRRRKKKAMTSKKKKMVVTVKDPTMPLTRHQNIGGKHRKYRRPV